MEWPCFVGYGLVSQIEKGVYVDLNFISTTIYKIYSHISENA